MQTRIIPKYLYDAWVEEGSCIDFEKEILVSEEDRAIAALEEMKEIWPDEEVTIEDTDDYIGDNIETLPITLDELTESADVDFISYTSKGGDEIVVINYLWNWE